jgi:hypothetical protein
VSRLPAFVLAVLAAATVGAFFVVQHLKVTTPLIQRPYPPVPPVINPVSAPVCGGVDHGRTVLSFYLQHRSDNVDVYVVTPGDEVVATIASGVYMQGPPHPVRRHFTWDGREDDGSFAPDGTYEIRVALIHQGRTVLLAPTGSSTPFTIKVETHAPRPVLRSVAPSVVPVGRSGRVRMTFSGTEGHLATVLLYRTDTGGRPRLAASFISQSSTAASWSGRIGGRPAPAGIYLVGLEVLDAACNLGRSLRQLPPAPGTTPGAGLTVRYVAAEPPLTPVPAGAHATVTVDSRGRPYQWALRAAGSARVLERGASSSTRLRVGLPHGHPGMYALTLRTGTHSTTVPLVASGPGDAPVLVVLPSLTWDGLAPVDETGDGLPSTLAAGDAVRVPRFLAAGMPAGAADEAEVLAALGRAHVSYQLTTDLGLIAGAGPRIGSHRAVVLAGDEQWVTPELAAALRSYARGGGNVLALGADTLLGEVTLAGGRTGRPRSLGLTDVFGIRHGAGLLAGRSSILAISDGLGLFAGWSGQLIGGGPYRPITGVPATDALLSSAGPTGSSLAIAGVRVGDGIVTEIALPGFAGRLAGHVDARELLSGVVSRLAG